MKEVLVFFITGFMDSGKTSLINETIYGSEFKNTPEKKLIICCEDGEEEYDEDNSDLDIRSDTILISTITKANFTTKPFDIKNS